MVGLWVGLGVCARLEGVCSCPRREDMATARDGLPGLDSLAHCAYMQLPEHVVDGREIELLHGHVVDQGSEFARFSDHQDTEEETAGGRVRADRRVVFTAVVLLGVGEGPTSMRVLGRGEIVFESEVGSGVVFRSELWHRSERAAEGVWKLVLFYGYFI